MLRNIFGGSSGSGRGNDFVGQNVELGQQKLRIKRVLGEGGYGFVFSAQDVSSGKEYALKRLMAPEESVKQEIMQEINFLKKLKGHPNIIKFVAAASSGNEPMSHGMTEFLILTELCSGGQLIDLLQDRFPEPFSFQEMIKIFAQTCKAVSHMHKQSPPIIHRDLKIENILFSMKGMIKLCDFGSATTKALFPDVNWTALQRSMAEDEIQKNTTPMYRAPEMIDLYSNHAITTKADVWALGCILYYLCYMEHPFSDSAKLKIMNAKYTVPDDPRKVSDLQPLIDTILQADPAQRPSVDDILFEVEAVANAREIDLKSSILADRSATSEATDAFGGNSMGTSGTAGSAILGNVVKGAGFLFNNIKDVSSKVVQSVAGYVRNDLDISYITGRIIVMSFPAEGIESTYKNSIDDVRTYFDSKYPDHYVVINISQRQYNVTKLNDRVFESGWNPRKSPSLNQLISLCRKINNFLRQDKRNVVAIHCLDGKIASAIMVAAFLIFCKLFKKPSMALDMFSLRRCQPGQTIDLNPSQRRYLRYVNQLIWEPKIIPHKRPLFLKTVTMSPVPFFNKARTGCRPFIEIFQGDQRILSTAQEIEQMREYLVTERKIDFNVNTKLHGDVTIAVSHARSTFGGKVQGKFTSFSVFTLQFHTGFIENGTTTVKFSRNELDLADNDDQKYPSSFAVTLDIVLGSEAASTQPCTEPWDKMNAEKLTPYPCFASKEEYWECREEFGLSEESFQVDKEDINACKPDVDHDKKVGRSTFFDNLQWSDGNSAGPGQQNGASVVTNKQEPDNSFSGFANLLEGTAAAELSGSESDDSSTYSERNTEMTTVQSSAPLIDIGFSFDSVTAPESDPMPTSKKTVQSNDLFDDDFANLRSDTNTSKQQETTQSLFKNEFSALRVETNLDRTNAPAKKSSQTSRNNNNNFGVLLNFETSDTSVGGEHVLKSPSTPNLPSTSTSVESPLIDTSDSTSNANATRSPGLKKNKSTSDLFGGHGDDDLFQELTDRHAPGNNDAHQPENLFSIRSNNFVDPFPSSPRNEKPSSSNFDAFSSTSSRSMRHSSSEGDLLGDWGSSDFTSSLKPTAPAVNTNTGMHRSASSSANLGNAAARKPADPFADFGNLTAGTFQKQGSPSPMTAAGAPASGIRTSKPQGTSSPFGSSGSFGQQKAQTQQKAATQQIPPPKRPTPTASAPNYNVSSAFSGASVFGTNQPARGGLGGAWGQRPASSNEFSDILGAQGFKPSSEQQKETLKQLTQQSAREEDDPIKRKIRDWSDGKERNIRALICSLDTVLWEGEDRWKPIGMHELIQPNQVRKWWKKACLSVHPDKHTGTPHEELAKAIFIELNEAWALFEATGSKALY